MTEIQVKKCGMIWVKDAIIEAREIEEWVRNLSYLTSQR